MNLDIIARHHEISVSVVFASGGISLGALEIPRGKWQAFKNLLGAGAASTSEIQVSLDEQ